MPKHAKSYIFLTVLALFFVSMNLRVSITSLSPVLLEIQQDLAISGAVVSLLTTIPVLCMGVFALLAGSVSAKFGEERTILGCVMLIGIATFSRLYTTSAGPLLITALAAGIGIAVASPLLSGFIKRTYPKYSSVMVGLYLAGMGTGAVISARFIIPISEWGGSWNAGLAFWSLFAVIGIVAWLPIVLKNKNSKKPEEAPVELPWGNRYVWLLMVIFGLQSGIFYSLSTWLAPLVESLGYTAIKSAGTVAVFQGVSMISGIVLPVLMNYVRTRRPWMLLCVSSTLIGVSGLLFFGETINPSLFAVFMGIGTGGLFPIILILPLDATTTARATSQWTALIQFGGYILSALIPFGIGVVHDKSGGFAEAFVTLISLISLLFMLILRIKDRS